MFRYYTYTYTYIHIHAYTCAYIYIYNLYVSLFACYTRSPLEDSLLFGPSPWKILAATNEQDMSEQPSPWRNLLSGNLVMETGCSWGLFFKVMILCIMVVITDHMINICHIIYL